MAKKILLVDDEKEVLSILKKKLQASGFEIFLAHNGQDALALSEDVHPDLILTDIAMPVLDGVRFFKELKQRPDLQHIPVMVSTAYGTTEGEMRELGVKDVLIKPYSPQSLIDCVNQYFNLKRARKVLIGTKMLLLMKSLLQEQEARLKSLSLELTNDPSHFTKQAFLLCPDLIVMDVDLFLSPTAEEIIPDLRNHPALKETVILVCQHPLGITKTSFKRQEVDPVGRDCLNKGATHYLGPLNKETLLHIINEYCLI